MSIKHKRLIYRILTLVFLAAMLFFHYTTKKRRNYNYFFCLTVDVGLFVLLARTLQKMQ